MTISIGLLGATGRMGRAIAAAADGAQAVVVGGIGREGMIEGSHADLASLAAACDVLVDFSTPDATAAHPEAATTAGTPILIGTTGLQPEHHALIQAASERAAVLQTANPWLGINVLRDVFAVCSTATRSDAAWINA